MSLIKAGHTSHLKVNTMIPVFNADWTRVLFIHLEVEPANLQKYVPYPIDLFRNKAYVSLVAFTMSRMSPILGGKYFEPLMRRFGVHEFLNVRTYVCQDNEPGIYFIKEWIPSRTSRLLAPLLYGLPYRHCRVSYLEFESKYRGQVENPQTNDCFQFEASLPLESQYGTCSRETLSHFLLERYTAYTSWNGIKRKFRIRHNPWLQGDVDVSIQEDSLLSQENWYGDAQLSGANYSRGTFGVVMGAPQFL